MAVSSQATVQPWRWRHSALGRTVSPLLLGVAMAGVLVPRDAAADQIAYITGGPSIWAWDTTTNGVSLVTTPGIGGLDSLIFDPQGNIVYDSFGSNLVGRYNVTTHVNSPVTGGFVGPADMALEPGGGTLLISNASGTTISRVNLPTSSAIGSVSVGHRPDGLAYDNAGNLFAVLGLNSVAQINPSTGAILKSISTPNAPDGLTFDAATGKLYVSSDGGGFYTLPTDLSSASFTAIPGEVFDGIASDGNSLLFVVRGTGGLLYDLGTNSIVETSPAIRDADDIAPVTGPGSRQSAPEPASIGIMGLGLAMLGVFRRRRSRRSHR
jgi:DNA-binding beta-propeller fold protein YncE